MKIFERLFPFRKKINKFPNESNVGKVKVIGSKIICTENHKINNFEINIDDLQFAYLIIDRNNQSYLLLFDHHYNSIPTNFIGFKNVYEELSDRFKFNNKLFFENVNKKIEFKIEIWRKLNETTYEILHSQHSDYEKGFEIQSPEKNFVSWDTTYDELEKNKNVFFVTSPYDQRIAKFKFPIRLGNILLYDFNVYFNNNRYDVPILKFYAECFDNLSSDKSYFDLKKVLISGIDIDQKSESYERSDQNNMNFVFDKMNLSIVYWYDTDWGFNCGYTSLTIENNREYPQLLNDDYYENNISITDFLILEGNIGFSEDYKRNKRIKRRPQKIFEQFQSKTVIWIDNVNNLIGFSSNNYSQLFHQNEIKSFCIQNILPAKGGGGSNLEIVLDNQNYNNAIFTEKCHFFDNYADKIIQLTNKQLTFGEEYHDC